MNKLNYHLFSEYHLPIIHHVNILLQDFWSNNMHISFNNTKFGFSFFIETNKDANNYEAFLSYILNRHPTKHLKAVDYNFLYTI